MVGLDSPMIGPRIGNFRQAKVEKTGGSEGRGPMKQGERPLIEGITPQAEDICLYDW